MDEWTQARLQRYIDDQVQEHLQLDYKAAAALNKDPKRNENITKDVSAFANSAGGVIIYGIKEDQNVPVSLDPVDLSQATRETLDQIIGTIQPKIDGVMIYPVTINNDSTKQIYIVQIPQSTTAHQARDRKYYKRLNTTSEAMQDYEIRDVMNRAKHPRLSLVFEIEKTEVRTNFLSGRPKAKPEQDEFTNMFSTVANLSFTEPKPETEYVLQVYAENTGTVYALYVWADIQVPLDIVEHSELRTKEAIQENDGLYVEETCTNLGSHSKTHLPILPSLNRRIGEISLKNIAVTELEGKTLFWTVYADNAPAVDGSTLLSDLLIIDKGSRLPYGLVPPIDRD